MNIRKLAGLIRRIAREEILKVDGINESGLLFLKSDDSEVTYRVTNKNTEEGLRQLAERYNRLMNHLNLKENLQDNIKITQKKK